MYDIGVMRYGFSKHQEMICKNKKWIEKLVGIFEIDYYERGSFSNKINCTYIFLNNINILHLIIYINNQDNTKQKKLVFFFKICKKLNFRLRNFQLKLIYTKILNK